MIVTGGSHTSTGAVATSWTTHAAAAAIPARCGGGRLELRPNQRRRQFGCPRNASAQAALEKREQRIRSPVTCPCCKPGTWDRRRAGASAGTPTPPC
jgi:hypothetical protein